jgi:hypothetical protein
MTRREWTVCSSFPIVSDENGDVVADCQQDLGLPAEFANATLIAAAPALLDALVPLLGYAAAHTGRGALPGVEAGGAALLLEGEGALDVAVDAARAALRKAGVR